LPCRPSRSACPTSMRPMARSEWSWVLYTCLYDC
jgi:hypothetical protein